MFKAIFLGQWFNLSDSDLSDSLTIRLDFMYFCRFPIGQVPDRTTFCRFRNLMVKKNIIEKLFNIVNKQLESRELKLEKSTMIIDATILKSAARPKQVMTINIKNNKNDDDDIIFDDN